MACHIQVYELTERAEIVVRVPPSDPADDSCPPGRRMANSLLRPLGLMVHDDPADGVSPSIGPRLGRYSRRVPLPHGAAAYLRPDNPVLVDLRHRYASVSLPMAACGVWRPGHRLVDLKLSHFRGDNAYLWQLRNMRRRARERYLRYAEYLRGFDHAGLLDRLGEDGAFGCWAFEDRRGRLVSRDLLDSVNEIYFLDRVWGLLDRGGATVVDIGAGYGRLAHRMTEATAHLAHYYCVDAVPQSTFLCQYYLRHRRVDRATAVPLDQLNQIDAAPDLAVNIHSFSEMPLTAIDGWLGWLSGIGVPRLLVVSNEADRLLSLETDGVRRDALPLLARHGYRLIADEFVVRDPETRRRLGTTDKFLFFGQG